MQKLKNIEFLRTLLILLIIFHHAFIDRSWTLCTLYPQINIYKTLQSFISHAYNAVEAFFIISGFFLGMSKKTPSVIDFIKKKFARLLPVIAFSMIICLVGTILGAFHFNVIANLMTVLLLNNIIICNSIGQNPILWYTSALFGGLLIYFLILKHSKNSIPIIATLTVFSYLVLEVINHGQFNHPLKNYYYVFNIGFLRAMGGIGLGILISKFWTKYSAKISEIKINTIFYDFSEMFFFSLFIWWLATPHLKCNNFIFVGIFTVLFMLFLIKKGFISKLTDNDIWQNFGKYQYCLYVIHYVIIKITGIIIWQKYPQFVGSHPILPIFIMFVIIVVLSVFAYHFVEIKGGEFTKKCLKI